MSRGAGDTYEFDGTATARSFIALGIPTYGQVNIFWASRVFGQLRHPMNRDVRHYIILGNEVGTARNAVVAKALAAEEREGRPCSHVFFIDDDVLVHPESLLRLIADDRPIVSGLYFAKSATPQALVLMPDGIEKTWRPGDLVDCWAHGMGLTLVRADVFKRLRDETDLGTDANGHPNWFTTTKDRIVLRPDGMPAIGSQTEDVAFLRRAAEIGYQPCVDTGAQAFGWHWAQHEQRAYPLRQWREFQDKGTITWTDTPDGEPVVWTENAA